MPKQPVIPPVGSVSPVLPLKALGNAADEPGFRFEQLNLARLNTGQLYQGRVVVKLDAMSFLVALNGGMLRMALDKGIQTGESVVLRYLGGFPQPAFLLIPPSPSRSQASLSPTARMLGQLLIASDNGPPRFEASQPVTDSPGNSVARISSDLRQALSMSGLFYESHLAEYLAGKRPLSALLQEPQNQPSQTQLIPKQLQILEQQRLQWHGEVWPGQTMEWEIRYEKHQDEEQERQQYDSTITNSITLQLPRLGKVYAVIYHAGERLRIELWAEQDTTAGLLARESTALAKRLQAAGQHPDQVTVRRNERATSLQTDSRRPRI